MWNFKKWVDPGERFLKKAKADVQKINEREADYAAMSDEQLKNQTNVLKQRLANGETLDDLLIDAFATVREAAKRTINQRHYDVQLLGAMVLHDGSIAEMKTGEGKTLASTLSIYLNALSGNGVHVITANEYLASRDCQEMGTIYGFLGLSVGLNLASLSLVEKREAYAADVTYGTASEFGFDYLRDNMVVFQNEKVQRPLTYAIVDEVDSILVDEARTPLIISGQDGEGGSLYSAADRFVRTLQNEKDYTYDLESKTVSMTDEGVVKGERFFSVDNLYDYKHVKLTHHIDLALQANVIMRRDVDYMVRDGAVLIIDSFTGRVMDGRRYSDGLHQAIEAKEGVAIERESRTMATVTIQNYFRMYQKLAGMTGTAKTEEEEFQKIYNMDVISVPTNLPIERNDYPDLIFISKEAKFKRIIEDIQSINQTGQPILVGTISVETSEHVSSLLKKKGVKHNILNAKNHGKEAEIIAEAGKKGAVTIATNMAGRGTDIKLGEGVRELGGLAVIGTEKHESRRIDNQLRGRSGRQGDPGMSRFYLSAEDELMERFGGENLKRTMKQFRMKEDDPLESKMLTKTIESSQRRVEGNHFDMRKRLLEYDDVVRVQRETIYAQRDRVLMEDETKPLSLEMIKAHVRAVVDRFTQGHDPDTWDLEGLHLHLSTELIGANELDVETLRRQSLNELHDTVWNAAEAYYNQKEEEFGHESMRELEKILMLRSVDESWVDHLDSLSQLREGIHLRAYAQTDPLKEYQMEGYQMFEELIERIQKTYSRMILRIQKEETVRREQTIEGEAVHADSSETVAKKPFVKATDIGRNEPCPCGSGKKYKKCCGQ